MESLPTDSVQAQTLLKQQITDINEYYHAALYAAQFYQVADAVGFHHLDAAAQSIEILREIPLKISLGGYLLLVYAIRVLSAFFIGTLIMLISKLAPNRISAICIATALLVVPAIFAI